MIRQGLTPATKLRSAIISHYFIGLAPPSAPHIKAISRRYGAEMQAERRDPRYAVGSGGHRCTPRAMRPSAVTESRGVEPGDAVYHPPCCRGPLAAPSRSLARPDFSVRNRTGNSSRRLETGGFRSTYIQ